MSEMQDIVVTKATAEEIAELDTYACDFDIDYEAGYFSAYVERMDFCHVFVARIDGEFAGCVIVNEKPNYKFFLYK